MRIKFKGKDLGEWKGAPRLKEARLVKQTIGLLPQDFIEAVSQMDPDALCMLVSLMYTRNGQLVSYEEIDGEYEDFELELSDEEKRQAAEQETAVLSPAITAALRELGVNPDPAHVSEVVLRHVEAAQKRAQEGKVEPVVASTVSSTETSTSKTETVSTS